MLFQEAKIFSFLPFPFSSTSHFLSKLYYFCNFTKLDTADKAVLKKK